MMVTYSCKEIIVIIILALYLATMRKAGTFPNSISFSFKAYSYMCINLQLNSITFLLYECLEMGVTV